MHGQFFIDHVLEHGTEGCNYLLAVDVDMNTVDGYAMSSWERGYGDMFFEMDLTTLRRTPGHPASVTIQSDLTWLDGSGEVVQSPRTILKRQVAAAEADGYAAFAGTELEFILFEDSYETAWDRRYQGLTGANRYNVDYSILGGSKVEPVLREIRNEMYAAGMNVESAKGECNFGQHEIGFLFDGVRAHLRQPLGLQDRRQGDRGPARPVAHLHGQVRRARGQLVPHPPVPARHRRRGRLRRRRPRRRAQRAVRPVHGRACSRRCASSPTSTRRTSTPTSGSPPARSRRPPSPGARTTAPARCGSSATAPGCASRTACPAATSTPTSPWRR